MLWFTCVEFFIRCCCFYLLYRVKCRQTCSHRMKLAIACVHTQHTHTDVRMHTHFTFIIILLYVQFQQVDRKCTIMKSMEDEILSNQTDWKYKMVSLSLSTFVCVVVWTYQRIIRTAYVDQLFHNICNSFSFNHWFYCRITKCMLALTTFT